MKNQNSLQFNMRKNIGTSMNPANVIENSCDLLDFYLQNPMAKWKKE